jgi:hypothetical protein
LAGLTPFEVLDNVVRSHHGDQGVAVAPGLPEEGAMAFMKTVEDAEDHDPFHHFSSSAF